MATPDNVILVGFSGTGKTLVGKEVARLLGWTYVDMDEEIKERAGKPIAAIFTDDGEPAFRRLEKRVLQEVCSGQGRVIATGGGAVVDPENREVMLKSGVVVCLDALPETIYSRLNADRAQPAEVRPLLSGPEPLSRIKALKVSRQGYYSVAHRTVDTDDLSVAQVAQEVVSAWLSYSTPKVGDPQ